ncbi:amino acid ABC transporter ATP-binding protein [Acuticoccus sp. M5D2P5]|uniref:amino acid ABC transporter ATP-binding protein n=1 Tax=Acuticoccus kalidii TaxID=2910977 RepID=UPI001F3A0607|nr:amino acid ABC transporter ATP-binding protein [Acuticoccus kalidii]MCF3934794.1 amino acid ABC transporter ATP-binding protein [Acuticoccus kalidii]
MIVLNNVEKRYGSLEVLKGVSFTVETGEVLSIIGPSGSGKSTILQCMNGLEPIQGGEIIVDGVSVHAKGTNLNTLRQKIGIVFQQFNTFPHLTAIQNAALGPRRVLGAPKKEAVERARVQLEKVGLGDKLDHYPSQLSGGQQQRLAIARALAMEPSYMLFDEVTSALDPGLVREVLETMKLLAEDGMTIVAVTHEMAFARDVSTRVAYFDAGNIVEIGPAREIFANPAHASTSAFLSHIQH